MLPPCQLAKLANQGRVCHHVYELYRVERSSDRACTEDRKKPGIVPSVGWLSPGVSPASPRMFHVEDLDVAVPDTFAEKGFMDPNGFQMP